MHQLIKGGKLNLIVSSMRNNIYIYTSVNS